MFSINSRVARQRVVRFKFRGQPVFDLLSGIMKVRLGVYLAILFQKQFKTYLDINFCYIFLIIIDGSRICDMPFSFPVSCRSNFFKSYLAVYIFGELWHTHRADTMKRHLRICSITSSSTDKGKGEQRR